MDTKRICIDRECRHTIIPRAAWGAISPKKSIKTQRYKSPQKELQRIVIHHAAFTPHFPPLALQKYSMRTRGFDDIGYHFYILGDGTVYEGRELKYGGAHAGVAVEATATRNFKLDPDYGSIGIAVAGCFHEQQCREAHHPSEAQKLALGALIVYLRERFPKIGKGDILPHSEVKEKVIKANGQTPAKSYETACPGELIPWVETFREGLKK